MNPELRSPAPSNETASPDTVVVGGGLVGICTALYLQRTGRRVTVIERHRPGFGASGHNGGVFGIASCVPLSNPKVLRSVPRMLLDRRSPLVIRWSYVPRLAPWLVRFAIASRSGRVEPTSIALASLLDRALADYATLLAGSPAESLVAQGGLLYAYRSDALFEADHESFAVRARRGVEFETLDSAAVAQADPVLEGRFRHAFHVPGAPFTTDPEQMNQLLAGRFQSQGGTLLQSDVYSFDHGHGVVRGVMTSAGRISAAEVVIAAGAWSRPLVKKLGVGVPLDTERGYGIDVPDPGLALRMPVIVQDDNVALTPHRQGLRITGIDELAGVDAPPNFANMDRTIEQVRNSFPDVDVRGGRAWMSYRPSMPDSLPVIGRAPRHANAFFAFGHGHTGMCMAAVTGRLIQELADDKPPSVDLRPFSPTRFAFRRRAARPGAR